MSTAANGSVTRVPTLVASAPKRRIQIAALTQAVKRTSPVFGWCANSHPTGEAAIATIGSTASP